MYRFLVVLFVLLLPTSLSSEEIESHIFSELSKISGKHYLLLEAAVATAEKRSLEISEYELVLIKQGDEYVVSFLDPNRPELIFGSSPNMNEFEVVLQADGSVIRANFVR